MASAAWKQRNDKAQQAGFRNYWHYRRTIEKNPAARRAADAAGRRGIGRYLGAGLQANLLRLPGRKGSKLRGRYVASLVADIYDEGGNPSVFLEAIGSPRRGKAA